MSNHSYARTDLVELCTYLIFTWGHLEDAETRVLGTPSCCDRVETVEKGCVILWNAVGWVLLVRLLLLPFGTIQPI